jgi:glycosyltransferase A (GT-A) superfamily protein (DUF2064 family)
MPSTRTIGPTHLLVMAKSPVPGQVKTRLCPPCTPEGAASVAEAALADTLEAVAACGADRRILALAGAPGPWLPPGFEVVAQVGTTFNQRLAAAWAHARGPGLQIGMDTPQVTADLLDVGLSRLLEPDVDAALGPACDGGWWAIGLRRAHPATFVGVPMSSPRTADHQRRRLAELELSMVDLPVLRDIDTIDDALAVSHDLPGSRTAGAVAAALGSDHEAAGLIASATPNRDPW